MNLTQLDYLKGDELLYPIIQQLGAMPALQSEDPFLHLLRTVAGQQLSIKAAASIFEKFTQLLPHPTPENVLLLTVDDLRHAGFSYSKAGYLHNIAKFWVEHNLNTGAFANMDDEAIIDLLTQIKGVGRWTVEIVLAFSLDRPNIFFADDLGIQQGMAIIYGWDTKNKKELRRLMLEKARSYAPCATLVCRYIWKWKNFVKYGQAV